MAKKELKMHAVVSPAETVIVSAYDESGKAEACTLAFYMVSSHVPPCVTIAINASQRRKTLKAMLQSGAFVLGFPSTDQVREADYLGIETGYNTDKLKNIGFTTSEGAAVHAPVINELRLSLECEIVHTVTVGSHMQVTGEVKRILADETVLNEKDKIDIRKLRPIIYDEEQLQYLAVGEKVADAFKETGDGSPSLSKGEPKNRPSATPRYTLKVYPQGQGNKIYRVLEISGRDTLDKLCEFIMEAFDFCHEHLYEFCMDNKPFSKNAYCYDPEGEFGLPSTDIAIEKLGLVKGQKFTLHYDFGDDWMFTITVQKIEDEKRTKTPKLVKSKGVLYQYSPWEDKW